MHWERICFFCDEIIMAMLYIGNINFTVANETKQPLWNTQTIFYRNLSLWPDLSETLPKENVERKVVTSSSHLFAFTCVLVNAFSSIPICCNWFSIVDRWADASISNLALAFINSRSFKHKGVKNWKSLGFFKYSLKNPLI